MTVSIIVAVSENQVIGKDNRLIWRLPADIKFFKEMTSGHCVITGRKNYESIPEKFRPLPGRDNIVVTRQENYRAPGANVVHSLDEAFVKASEKGEEEVFIIGGEEIYRQSLPIADKIYLTHIYHSFEGDAFFPSLDMGRWKLVQKEDFGVDEKHAYAFSICEYVKIV